MFSIEKAMKQGKKGLVIKFLAAVLASCIFYVMFKGEGSTNEWEEVVFEDTVEVKPETIYGFEKDSFFVVEDKIKPNQFLADILLKYKIPYPKIDQLVRETKEVFDIRKLASNHKYTLLCTKDSLPKAQYFIYEITKVDYVVFEIGEKVTAYREKKPVEIVERRLGGVIKSSLYQTMTEIGVNPVLASELADIYAWSIDFYRIQKDDAFKVVFEEHFVDGVSVGIGNIKYAYFKHSNEDFYAIYFVQDEIGAYYDQDNRSLRKAFLKAPLKFSRISSRYTKKRFHPVQKRWKAHLGTDYAAPTGTPIMSVSDGVVVAATWGKYNGNYVKIKHNATYTTQYLHMSKIKSGIKKGVRVRQGDVIGYVGQTGLATGPHLCYRFWKNGKQVDPYKQKLPASKPIKDANKPTYEKIKAKVIEDLDGINYSN